MATYYRQTGVLTGQLVTLYAIFTDDTGCLVDPDTPPEVYIYDTSVDLSQIETEVDAATYASALSGPTASTQVSTGYYKYEYTVPSGADAGTWYDVWVATVDTVDAGDILSFTVGRSADVTTQPIGNNTMLVVKLDSSVASSTGDTLGSDTTLYYTTTYHPLYASPDMIRMEIGRWIEAIPDNTLALMAHWSSKEADFIHGAQAKNAKNLKFAKSRFVMYDSALKCLSMPGGGAVTASSASTSGGKKQLGDLAITAGGSSSSGSLPVIDDDILDYFHEQRREWFRVVNAGGTIVPGGGFNPTFAQKGRCDPGRPLGGRLWDDPREYHYRQPTTNRKVRRPGMTRGRYTFVPGRYWWDDA